jgi:hypothetical protein
MKFSKVGKNEGKSMAKNGSFPINIGFWDLV